jgi:hypothetical protein
MHYNRNKILVIEKWNYSEPIKQRGKQERPDNRRKAEGVRLKDL